MLEWVTPADETDLVSLAAAKAELAITGSGSDSALEERIGEVSADVAGRCNRDVTNGFGEARAKETLRGRLGSKFPIWLRHWPVTNIVSVTEDGTALTSDEYLLVEGRQIYRRDATTGKFICWAGCDVVVTYDGGYALPASCPADLRRAVLTMLAASWKQTGRDPSIRSEEVPDVMSVTYALTGALPAHVEATLSRYTNLNTG